MGNLRACFAVALLALAACGSDHATPDASIKLIDAPPVDMKIWEDAPPPMYDLTCLNDAAPTTAPDPITISGNTLTLSMSGAEAVPNVAVDVFEVDNPTAVATVTSDSTGAFMTDNIATGGTPIDGYVRGVAPPPANQGDPAYRSTYTYPGTVVAASLTGVPIVMISTALFTQVEQVANPPQDDTVNGALLVQVADCAGDAISGANVVVEQNSMSAGQVFDLGAFVSQAAGTFFVFNVPEGKAQVKVSYDGMAFPVRTVSAFKAPMQDAEGTITALQVTPSN